MNGMNEKTPESHECKRQRKRQRRLQKQREQRRTRLACEKKEQRQRRLQERRLQLHFRMFGSFGLLQYKVIMAINNTWSLTTTFLLKDM